MDELNEIAARIRELREISDYTQEELAAELKIDLETYKKYEETGTDVPISFIYQIAKKFNVDCSEILSGVSSKLHTYQIIRAGEGQTIKRYPGYEYKGLAYHFSNRLMQPLMVSLDPTKTRTSLSVHTGEEFNYVISGKVSLMLDDKEIILNAGDSAYFNSSIPHGQNCYGDEPASIFSRYRRIVLGGRSLC